MDNTLNFPSNYYSPQELRNLLRLLASQNSMWTRSYIVSYVADLDDIVVLEDRLNMNAIDFRNVFNVYYSKEISEEFEFLLREYIRDMIQYLSLLKRNYIRQSSPSQGLNTNLEEELANTKENWNATGIEIAAFLSSINSNWPFEQMKTLILDHIEMTTHQMEQRLRKDYTYEVSQYDFIEYHSLLIADVINNGIIEMFY